MSSKPELTIDDALRNAERSLNRSHLRPARGAESILLLLKRGLNTGGGPAAPDPRVDALEEQVAKLHERLEALESKPAPVDDVVAVTTSIDGMNDLLGSVGHTEDTVKETPRIPPVTRRRRKKS